MIAQFLSDSIVVLPPVEQINVLGAVVIGAAAALGSGLIGSGARAVDNIIGKGDAAIRNAIGPMLPLVTVGFSIAMPALAALLGINDLPPAEVVASAPLAAIFGVTLREVGRKWILPALGKRRAP